MKTILHAMFGMLSLAIVLASLIASLVTELWYSQSEVAEVKTLVFKSIWYLLPFLGFAALLGLSLGKERQGKIVDAKKRRMVWIMSFVTLVLLPTSYLLNSYARSGQFNTLYFIFQTIEYIFDIATLILLALNIRDGNKLVDLSKDGLNDE